MYRAIASIELEGVNENFLNIKDVMPTTMHYVDDVQTQVKLMQSRTLVTRVIQALRTGAPSTASTGTKPSPSTPPSSYSEAALAAAARTVKIKSTMNTRVLDILCDSADRNLAADFANTLVTEYIEQAQESRWEASQRTGRWLARQLGDLKQKVESSEAAAQAYARGTGLLFTGENESKDNVAEEALRQLDSELLRAQADRIQKQSRYELAVSAERASLPEVLDDDLSREYKLQLADLRRQLAELSTVYNPEYHKVQRVQAQINDLESTLKKSRAGIVDRLRHDFQSAQRRELLLDSDAAAQIKRVTEQRQTAIRYQLLKKEADGNRQIYEAMMHRVKEAGIASALQTSGVRIVDRAEPPPAPSTSNFAPVTLLGLFAGLLLGGVFAVRRDQAHPTLEQPGDARRHLDLLELGAIASAKNGLTQRLGRSAIGRNLKLIAPDPVAGLERVTWTDKTSLIAECFRAAVSSILLAVKDVSGMKLYTVTSPDPQAGKTSVAVNLAIALADVKKTVLLVDADMRGPHVHNIFGAGNDTGLSTLLASPDARACDAALPTDIPGLFVIPAGPPPAATSSLLHYRRTAELLYEFRKHFDAVVIDTPPILAFPDARLLGRFSDAVILVLRAGRTTLSDALLARQHLVDDGTTVLGALLNDCNPRKTPHSYYRVYQGR
jgi:capsular exopolysaccharide synthesis family protein